MKHKIMIVDDEADIVCMLKGYFEKREYEVISAYDGFEAVNQLDRKPDIILLDINMPQMDGIEVCKKIRAFVNCPIVFLTARIEDKDKVLGFAVGGDDYIMKPFSIVELEARIQAHIRRDERRAACMRVKFSDNIVIDYQERIVYYKNETILFVKKEFDIVELLSKNVGQIFDKERIYDRVWGWNSNGDSSVVVEHIRRIRAKFSEYGCSSPIETVWGCGYKWKR